MSHITIAYLMPFIPDSYSSEDMDNLLRIYQTGAGITETQMTHTHWIAFLSFVPHVVLDRILPQLFCKPISTIAKNIEDRWTSDDFHPDDILKLVSTLRIIYYSVLDDERDMSLIYMSGVLSTYFNRPIKPTDLFHMLIKMGAIDEGRNVHPDYMEVVGTGDDIDSILIRGEGMITIVQTMISMYRSGL